MLNTIAFANSLAILSGAFYIPCTSWPLCGETHSTFSSTLNSSGLTSPLCFLGS